MEIDAYGATKIWDDQGLKSNAILMAMVHINHGRLTGQVGGQVYRFLREVAAFWECYLIKTPLATGGEPPRYRWHLGCILLKMAAC